MATIVDIDDTLLRNGSQPIQRVIDYVNALPGPKYIVTGRPKSMRAETVRALKNAGVHYSRLIMNPYSTSNSNKHKSEVAERLKGSVSLAIENNPEQRAIYSRHGIKTLDPSKIKDISEKFWNFIPLKKAGKPEEDYSQYSEYNDNIGYGPVQYKGPYYELEIEFDTNQDMYVVTIDWNKGGSSELTVDGSEAEDILTNGLDESKRNPPMPWPFGSKDFLHWPNQR